MAKKSSSIFEKMGTTVAQQLSHAVPQRGMSVKKQNAKGGMLEGATAGHRRSVQERLGAKLAPTAILYQQNAAEASLTQRNVVTVRSAMGNRDFWEKRGYGQVMQ